MIPDQIEILTKKGWNEVTRGTAIAGFRDDFLDELNRWTGDAFQEGKTVYLTDGDSKFALKPSNILKAKIIKAIAQPNTPFALCLETLFDVEYQGGNALKYILNEIANGVRSEQKVEVGETYTFNPNEPSDAAIEVRKAAFERLIRPFVVRQVFANGFTTNILCYAKQVEKDANGNEYEKLNVGTYPVESRGSYQQKIYQWLTQYAWTERMIDNFYSRFDAMEVKTPTDFVIWALEQIDKDRSLWVSDHVPIISNDENEFSWGRLRKFKDDGFDDFDSWLEFEEKFQNPKMVFWWRLWLAQLFDENFATGRTFAGTIDAGNLGICVIRSPGGEGSSTILDVVRANLGNTLCCAARLNGDQFEQSTYYGKRLAIKDDGKEKRILFRGAVHSMVVGATNSVEAKGKNAKTLFINCGVLMSTNYPLVANVHARDQMRRLIYIVLNPAKGKKTANWKSRLNSEFGAYVRTCLKQLNEFRETAAVNPNDIFQFPDDIIEHYKSVLQPDLTATATEYLLRHGIEYGEGNETTIEGIRFILSKVVKSIGNEKFDSDNALRQIEQTGKLRIQGLRVIGGRIKLNAQQLKEYIIGINNNDLQGNENGKANDE